MPEIKITEAQMLDMKAVVLHEIAKKCIIEDCSPEDFLGHRYNFPILVGGEFGSYDFEVTRGLISDYEILVRKTTEEMEKRFLNGASGGKPKGLLGG